MPQQLIRKTCGTSALVPPRSTMHEEARLKRGPYKNLSLCVIKILAVER